MTVINGTPGDDVLNRNGSTADPNAPGLDVYGFAGNDVLFGSLDTGAVNLYGGTGNDTYYVYVTTDSLAMEMGVSQAIEARNQGIDTVYAYHRIDHLFANVENLRLISGAVAGGNDLANDIRANNSSNTVRGYGGNDTLQGLGGNDIIQGGNGYDKLDGGAGRDILTGGTGADLFMFKLRPGGANIDTITDFSHAQRDHIQLENAVFRGLATGGLSSAAFHVGAAAHDANDRIIYNSKTGALYYDADGSGAGHQVQIAVLTGHPALSVHDFLVV